MTRSPWKYRKYQLATAAANATADIVFVITLGFCNPGWGAKVTRWSLHRIAVVRRAKSPTPVGAERQP